MVVRTIRVLGDLTLGADIARVVETTIRELGPIDILVHNAGGDIAAKGGKPDPTTPLVSANRTCAPCWIELCSVRS